MCYNLQYYTRKMQEYAKRLQEILPEEAEAQIQLQRLAARFDPMWHADAFAHPLIPVITSDLNIEAMHWGLVPHWVKDFSEAVKIRRQTLNARGETIFEKPAFRYAAKQGRCLIIVDGFYEYHHLAGKAYPFFVKMKNNEPLLLGGLYSRYLNQETGEEYGTASVVTTEANRLLQKIHNNPKGEGHRMPLILKPGTELQWLQGSDEAARELISPLPDGELSAHTVNALKGKSASGNIPEASNPIDYGFDELSVKDGSF